MCSVKKKTNSTEIQLFVNLSEQLEKFYLSKTFADVEFIIENQKIHAHRLILAMRSEYFNVRFGVSLKKNQPKETMKLDVSLKTFQAILKYLYTGSISLLNVDTNELLNLINLAQKFRLSNLSNCLLEYVQQTLVPENIGLVLKQAKRYNLNDLYDKTLTYADENPETVLHSDSFIDFPFDILFDLLKRDTFAVDENYIFLAVKQWLINNPETDTKSVLSLIRFPLMSDEYLLNTVQPSGLMNDKEIVHILKEKKNKNLKYRVKTPASSCPTYTYVSTARIIQNGGQMMNVKLLDCNVIWHNLPDKTGIIIELENVCIFNNISFELEYFTFSYTVDVSVDQNQWTRMIDYSSYHCRSIQNLFFTLTDNGAKYIRICGNPTTLSTSTAMMSTFGAPSTSSTSPLTADLKFQINHLNIQYTNNQPKLIKTNGVITPTNSITHDALILSRNRKTILTDHLSWPSHRMNDGNILIQLTQPYNIASLAIRLGNCLEYNLTIDTSTDNVHWELAVKCRSTPKIKWQNFTFKLRSVVYVRIKGESYGGRFYIDDLQCPSQQSMMKPIKRLLTGPN